MSTAVSVASLASGTAVAAPSIAAEQPEDPMFAVISRFEELWERLGEVCRREPNDLKSEAHAAWEREQDEITIPLHKALDKLFDTAATTRAGAVAQIERSLRYFEEVVGDGGNETRLIRTMMRVIPQLA